MKNKAITNNHTGRRFNVINAEDQVIRTLVAGSVEAASDKLRFLYGRRSSFLRLEVQG